MWKHKTKWLVRGGRKVKCYLCGKKILASGDLFLFHGDTGYYSHQACQAESTTISGNERRRAVKKIAVGAAIVGAIAAGAGKLIDISSQSKGSNSPAAQTILTSQGLIPPALTSDPANPVPGQMWYRSDAGVMAHFDGVQNRVVYSSEINDGNVYVTSKGIVNGLSVLPNDGTGWFGPDTTLNATAPGQYGGTYTKTSGWSEGFNYAITNAKNNGGQALPVRLLSGGSYQIDAPIVVSPTSNVYGFTLEGDGQNFTEILTNVSSDYVITFDMTNFQFANFSIKGIGGINNKSSTGYGFIKADMSGTTNTYSATMYIESLQIGTNTELWTEQSLYLNEFQTITTVNYTDYNNVGSGAGSVGPSLIANNVTMIGSNFVSTCTVGGSNNMTLIAGGKIGNSVIISSDGCTSLHIQDMTLGNLSLSPDISVNFVKLENILQYKSNTVLVQNTGTTTSYIQRWIVDGYLYNNSTYTNFYDSYITPAYFKFTRIYASGSSTTTVPIAVPSTPTVPSSGTAQENTNLYPVDVYVYGGDVTEIQITRNATAYTVFSVSTAIAMSGQHFPLSPTDSITITYTTAPTWEWLSTPVD